MKKLINKYRYDLMLVTGLIIIGLTGNLIYADDVAQQKRNCESAVYALGNECGDDYE
jgi:hypothetical protein